LSEFRVISRLWEATTVKRMKIDLYDDDDDDFSFTSLCHITDD